MITYCNMTGRQLAKPKRRRTRTVKRTRRKAMTYDQAVKVLLKHKVIRSKADLEGDATRSGGLLLGAI